MIEGVLHHCTEMEVDRTYVDRVIPKGRREGNRAIGAGRLSWRQHLG